MTKLHDPIDDQELDRRLRATFHTVMPMLDVPQQRGLRRDHFVHPDRRTGRVRPERVAAAPQTLRRLDASSHF